MTLQRAICCTRCLVGAVALVLGRVTDHDLDLHRELKDWGPRDVSVALTDLLNDRVVDHLDE